MIEQAAGPLSVLGPVALVGFALSLALTALLRPWLARYAMAQPNARSSHRQPTPQGGGIAVVTATLLATWSAAALFPVVPQNLQSQLLAVTAASALLAVIGAIDDIRPLPEAVRLAMQGIAVGTVLAALPNDLQLLPQMPWWLERACLFFAAIWFINLVNFMDGIDWMTVAEVVPASGALVLLGLASTMPLLPAVIAAALMGAMLGFAPFNKPVARIFLGDVGSLPIGLLLGWLLLQLAAVGHLAAALLLPLYYLCDATITLGRRITAGEPFWQAHRSHFYQRATDNGFSVPAIILRVAAVNLALAVLAGITVAARNTSISAMALAAGTAIVTWLLRTFARAKR